MKAQAERELFELFLIQRKTTKRTVVYTATDESDDSPISSLYVSKSVLGKSFPERIVVRVSTLA